MLTIRQCVMALIATLGSVDCSAADVIVTTGVSQGVLISCTWTLDGAGLVYDKSTGHWVGTAAAAPTCVAAQQSLSASDAAPDSNLLQQPDPDQER